MTKLLYENMGSFCGSTAESSSFLTSVIGSQDEKLLLNESKKAQQETLFSTSSFCARNLTGESANHVLLAPAIKSQDDYRGLLLIDSSLPDLIGQFICLV